MTPVELVGEEVKYVTENSIWLIRQDTYCRMPRREEPRSYDSEALKDAVWHPHEGVWEIEDGEDVSLRVLPAGRPTGSIGLITSKLVAKISNNKS